MARNNKPIRCICLNTGVVYESMTAAARAMNLLPPEVHRVVIGDRKSARGLIFEQCPDEINNDNGRAYAEYRLIERAKAVMK